MKPHKSSDNMKKESWRWKWEKKKDNERSSHIAKVGSRCTGGGVGFLGFRLVLFGVTEKKVICYVPNKKTVTREQDSNRLLFSFECKYFNICLEKNPHGSTLSEIGEDQREKQQEKAKTACV